MIVSSSCVGCCFISSLSELIFESPLQWSLLASAKHLTLLRRVMRLWSAWVLCSQKTPPSRLLLTWRFWQWKVQQVSEQCTHSLLSSICLPCDITHCIRTWEPGVLIYAIGHFLEMETLHITSVAIPLNNGNLFAMQSVEASFVAAQPRFYHCTNFSLYNAQIGSNTSIFQSPPCLKTRRIL